MAGWKCFDFECECGAKWEDITREGTSLCPECGNVCDHVFTGSRINAMNLLSPEVYKEKMLKRSSDHTTRAQKRQELPPPKNAKAVL